MTNPLFVGVDIHRKNNVYCWMNVNGREVRPRTSLENNQPGTQAFIQQVAEIMVTDGFDELRVAAEATSWYWFHFFQSLQNDTLLSQWPLELFAINPRLTANFKKSYVDLDKTDLVDAFTVADRLRWGRDIDNAYTEDPRYLSLRFLTRYRYHVIHTLAREKAYCTAILYLKASEYSREDKQAFSNLFGAASRAVLQEFASMEEVAALPFDELVAFLNKQGRGHFADPEQTAHQLQRIAQDSYPLPEALQPAVNLVLSLSLKQITSLETQLVQVDAGIREKMEQIPNTLQTVPGLGPVFAAGILAEIGDAQRFGFDESKVAKYAGFKWRRTESAEFAAEETYLTRTGNPYLRYYFCEAAVSVQRWDKDYGAYYQRKFKEVRKHQHKRATVLTARKLVRLVVRLLASNQPYQSRRP